MKVVQKISNLLLVMTVLFAASSCSSNDDEPSTKADYTTLSGDYKGWTSAAFQYSPTPTVTPDETVNLAVTADGKATVTYNSDTWGKTTISGATVTINNGEYQISGTGKSTIQSMGSQETKDYDCNFTGTISSDKKTVSFVFTLPGVMGGTTITFALGDAPAAKVITGSYKGYSSGVFKYSPTPIVVNGEKIAITENEDGTVKVVFTSNAESENNWGTTTIPNATVTLDGDNYKIAGEGESLIGMHGAEAKEYKCVLSGTISKDKETVSLVFTLPGVMGGTTITFALGDAPTTNTSSNQLSYYLKKHVFNK